MKEIQASKEIDFEEISKDPGEIADSSEIWDIVDSEGRPTGRTMKKGAPMQENDYHPAVSVWIVNEKGEFLISRRVSSKTAAPGMWETTGGSALAGEDVLTAALREVREELGVVLIPEKGHILTEYTWPHSDGSGAAFFSVWLFRQEVPLADIVLQKEETCDVRWASRQELRRLIAEGSFIPYTYLEELFRQTEENYVPQTD
ncbi:MAG: NUDIX domain-containing protein [Oscillospiraceae bacterium]|nr:NUDIX domain-containing protein [Oscillospiraceae bacterium]